MGAFDFVEKPLSLEKTVLVIRNALHQRRLEAENRALRARVDRHQTMVGESYAMRQLREQVAMAAPTNGRVLIYGENGTGKELVARTVHALSRRRAGAFVEVNCAAIPEELIESELFGHVRGAFTGAVADRRGKFEVADGGTIFLDEPGDTISPSDLSFLDPTALSRPAAPEAAGERRTLHEARDQFERDLILRTLAEQQGNMSRTAEVLGVERSNLYRKMKAFGIAPARRAEEENEAV